VVVVVVAVVVVVVVVVEPGGSAPQGLRARRRTGLQMRAALLCACSTLLGQVAGHGSLVRMLGPRAVGRCPPCACCACVARASVLTPRGCSVAGAAVADAAQCGRPGPSGLSRRTLWQRLLSPPRAGAPRGTPTESVGPGQRARQILLGLQLRERNSAVRSRSNLRLVHGRHFDWLR
jgi:hypothetical protein